MAASDEQKQLRELNIRLMIKTEELARLKEEVATLREQRKTLKEQIENAATA